MQALTEPTLLQDTDCIVVSNVLSELTINVPSNQSKGGRPKESKNKKKKFTSLAKTVFVNETSFKFSEEKQNSKDLFKKGHFNEIFDEIRILRKIDTNVTISKVMIDLRIQRGNLIFSSSRGGKLSLLYACEDSFVYMIIKLSRCR